MKKILIKQLTAVLSCILMILVFSACGNKSGGTIDEPEITVDYLSGEYAEQLVRDGAETIIGSVQMSKEDDLYKIKLTEKEVNKSSDYKEGYYIAETNIVNEYTLDGDARLIYSDGDTAQVVKADDFIKKHGSNADQLYILYYMGDKAELLIPVDPEEVELF